MTEAARAIAKRWTHEGVDSLEHQIDTLVTEQTAALRAALKRTQDCLREIAGSPAEFDDDRIGYLTMQVDRGTLGEARALLAGTEEQS